MDKKANNKETISYRHGKCRKAKAEANRLEEEKKKEAKEEARRLADAERELLETPPLVINEVRSVEEEPSTSVCGPILKLFTTLDIKEEPISPITKQIFSSFEEITADIDA